MNSILVQKSDCVNQENQRVDFHVLGRREYSYTLFVVSCGSLLKDRERAYTITENGHLKIDVYVNLLSLLIGTYLLYGEFHT